MNLTTKGRYGLRAAFTLACRYGEAPISLRDIASQQQLAEKYLEQLLTALRKAGLVQTVRGAQGGVSAFRAARSNQRRAGSRRAGGGHAFGGLPAGQYLRQH